MNETGDESSENKGDILASLFEQCLASARRLATYAQEARREGSFDLGEFFRRAQAETRRSEGISGAEPDWQEDRAVRDDPSPAAPTHDEIAQRAFSIYQREGGEDRENWERAERELMERAREAAKREPDPPAPGES